LRNGVLKITSANLSFALTTSNYCITTYVRTPLTVRTTDLVPAQHDKAGKLAPPYVGKLVESLIKEYVHPQASHIGQKTKYASNTQAVPFMLHRNASWCRLQDALDPCCKLHSEYAVPRLLGDDGRELQQPIRSRVQIAMIVRTY